MKIPSNTILKIGTGIGFGLSAICSYWVGRRDELEQVINLGLDASAKGNQRILNVFNKKHEPVKLILKAIKD